MGLTIKIFNILGIHWKIGLLGGGGVHEKLIQREDCLKRGAWRVFRFKGEAWQERGGVVILRGVDTPMHTIITQ